MIKENTGFKANFFQPPYTEPVAGSVFLPMRIHWEKGYCNHILCYFVYFSYIILIKFKPTLKYLFGEKSRQDCQMHFFVSVFFFFFLVQGLIIIIIIIRMIIIIITSCFKSLRCCIPHANNCWCFNIYEQDKFHAELSMKKVL